MAIRLDFLGKDPNQTQDEYQYKDIQLDIVSNFTRNSQILKTNEQEDLESIYDINVLTNSVKNFLTTIPGQKLLNPFFGIDLRKYLFEPVNSRIASVISYDIKSQIGLFEPRITINDISVVPIPEDNLYVIEIFYTPILKNNKEPIKLEGVLNSDGYFIINTNTDVQTRTPSYL
jgi:phage baseplate assembly protein W